MGDSKSVGFEMAFLRLGAEVPLPPSCVYPGARLRVRAPARLLGGDYIVALGGSATFGKGVARPWPQLLEAATGRAVVNLGAVGAGPEAYLRDPGLLAACHGAASVVVQLPGAERVGNPYYRVHPRRNDRVIEVRAPLRSLYPEIDFHDIGFARALLERLHRLDAGRFAELTVGLQAAWADRMEALLDRLPTSASALLLWLGDRSMTARPANLPERAVPALVTADMLQALRPGATRLVEAVVPHSTTAGIPGLPSQSAHEVAAAALAAELALPHPDAFQGPRRAVG